MVSLHRTKRAKTVIAPATLPIQFSAPILDAAPVYFAGPAVLGFVGAMLVGAIYVVVVVFPLQMTVVLVLSQAGQDVMVEKTVKTVVRGKVTAVAKTVLIAETVLVVAEVLPVIAVSALRMLLI